MPAASNNIPIPIPSTTFFNVFIAGWSVSFVEKGVSSNPKLSLSTARPLSSCEYRDTKSDVAPIAAPLTKLPATVVAAPTPAAFIAGIIPTANDPKWTSPRKAPPHHVLVSIGFSSSTNASSHSGL